MESYIKPILIAVLEGLTEFIPVSSTGHMILFGKVIGFTGPKAEAFEIFIQLGAILAVLFLYRNKFLGLMPKMDSDSKGIKALIGGTVACFLTAAIAGMLVG